MPDIHTEFILIKKTFTLADKVIKVYFDKKYQNKCIYVLYVLFSHCLFIPNVVLMKTGSQNKPKYFQEILPFIPSYRKTILIT